MNNPSIPIKLAMARVIAQKILENPSEFRYESAVAHTFLANGDMWAKDSSWETGSPGWAYIAGKLPEILAKLAEIDGH